MAAEKTVLHSKTALVSFYSNCCNCCNGKFYVADLELYNVNILSGKNNIIIIIKSFKVKAPNYLYKVPNKFIKLSPQRKENLRSF